VRSCAGLVAGGGAGAGEVSPPTATPGEMLNLRKTLVMRTWVGSAGTGAWVGGP
jgi:hypothetical protein